MEVRTMEVMFMTTEKKSRNPIKRWGDWFEVTHGKDSTYLGRLWFWFASSWIGLGLLIVSLYTVYLCFSIFGWWFLPFFLTGLFAIFLAGISNG
jgi:hypothetical protein